MYSTVWNRIYCVTRQVSERIHTVIQELLCDMAGYVGNVQYCVIEELLCDKVC